MKNVQFEQDILAVPKSFPRLSVATENNEQFLKGELEIRDNDGKLWETYQVEIKGSKDYPNRFPKLFEIGNAFPKIADWHVYEEDDSCCIDVPQNELLICKDGLPVVDYISQYAIPYLANQKFRELEGYYLYGEYAHGILGRIEFYQSKLKAKNPLELLRMLGLIIDGYNPSRQAMCPFCHKSKFRKCHRQAFRELSAIKSFLYHDGVTQLIPFFKRNPHFQLPKVF